MTPVEAIEVELRRLWQTGDGSADGARRVVLALVDAGYVIVSDADEGPNRQSVTVEQIDAERLAGWVHFHPEDFCHRCGNKNVSWYVASEVWNPVMRGGDPESWGRWQEIVCQPCFVELAEVRGVGSSWTLRRDACGTQQLVRL